MIQVFIKTESHYIINKGRIRKCIERLLISRGVKGAVEVSVTVVGNRFMRQLNKSYRNIDKATDVLSFCLNESKDARHFIDPPDGVLRLGDIVVSYPTAIDDASDENMLVDDKIDELIEHGLLHLMGQHHD